MANPGAVLDLGCGTGRTSKPLSDMGHQITGVDIAPLMIQKAKELHPELSFYVGDAIKLQYEDQTFDYILFSFNGLDCLYPLEERLKALNEIHRVLKSGGLFIYSSHDRDTIRLNRRTLTRIRNHDSQYKVEKTVYGDLILYYGTRETNIQQLKQAGFKDIQHYPPEGKTWRYYVCRKC